MTVITALLLTLALLLVLVLGLSVVLYNKLVKGRNQMREGWSGIEVQLKRRHDLIPNLLATVRQVAAFEKDALLSVTEARQQAQRAQSEQEAVVAEKVLVQELGRIMVLSEGYPELSSAEAYGQFMEDLTEVEDQLQYARRYYNGSVRDYNNATETFPSQLIARSFGFQSAPFFEVEEVSERAAPRV